MSDGVIEGITLGDLVGTINIGIVDGTREGIQDGLIEGVDVG